MLNLIFDIGRILDFLIKCETLKMLISVASLVGIIFWKEKVLEKVEGNDKQKEFPIKQSRQSLLISTAL